MTKNSSLKKFIRLMVVGALGAACLLCYLAGRVAGVFSEPTPTVTATYLPTWTPAPSRTPRPAASQPAQGDGYAPLFGKIYTGVKVYFGDKKAYAFTVVGVSECAGMPSGNGVRVRYEDGTLEWKDREALLTGPYYVAAGDPAASAREVTILSGCE